MEDQQPINGDQSGKPAPRFQWYQAVMISPLIFLGLLFVLEALTPGGPFFPDRFVGVYWLLIRYGTIRFYLVSGMLVCAVSGMIVYIGRLTFRKPVAPRDPLLLAAMDILAPGLCCVFLSYWASIGIDPSTHHVDTRIASGHIYHLALTRCMDDGKDCSSEDFFRSKYFIMDCGNQGIICSRVYISRPIGIGTRDEFQLGLPVRPKLVADPSGRLRLVDGKAVLWQSP